MRGRLNSRVAMMVAALCALAGASGTAVQAEGPLRVVVTIKPIHSLVTALLAGVTEPRLIVEGQTSPHAYALRPSAVRAASEADVLVRVSPTVEPFTTRLVATLPKTVEVVTLATLAGLTVLPVRTEAMFEPHEHEAGHEHTAEHARAASHDDHARDPNHANDADHDAHAALAADAARIDGHIWLDPGNARRIVAALAAEFARRAPDQAARITANARALEQRIGDLEREIGGELASVKDRPFIVFHDAYQYLDRRYALDARGSITMSPEAQPSARRLAQLRRRLAEIGPVCVFAEPQFKDGVVATVIEGTSARSATLDPEGALLESGPELYFSLMRNLVAGIQGCLSRLPAK